MSENIIAGAAAERAAKARWENEGGRALPLETPAGPADLDRSGPNSPRSVDERLGRSTS